MTNEEVIVEIENMRKFNYTLAPNEVFDLAIDALKKQIPVKPDVYGDGYWEGELVLDTYECPRCGSVYEIEYDNYDYCPNCGQKFDWSVEE